MNRPYIANVAVSSSTLQQGLFLLLAVLMTLLACTAYQHLNAKPEPLLYPTHQASTTSHFSPVSTRSAESLGQMQMEQTAETNAPAPQQRWTF
jgi:hypothetical protein